MEKTLKMKTYKVRVLVVPPIYITKLTGEQPRYEMREIRGYTKKDAMKRAGIQ